jgi:hypothetical protein
MGSGSPGPPVGVVFRRLRSSGERELARSLLAAGGPSYRSPRYAGGGSWFGLWDLASAEGAGLVGVAATRLVTAMTVELCVVALPAALPWRGLGGRLVREVADTLRADGAEQMVARPATSDGQGLAVLRSVGFGPPGPQCPDLGELGSEEPDSSTVWLSLEL